MHEVDYIRTLAALLAVLGAIGLGFWLLRRLEAGGGLKRWLSGQRDASRARSGRRLDVVETRMIDQKTRLVLVRRDAVEHLLLLGPGGNLLIDRPAADSDA
ncbi:flagellar protein FliO/FliZ [Arboricoccus pini]|uniref:Flagellar protein FliO/FliZ n=1 Tax=Arboricoccus pini TaxID=1963835 RepID=A0A212R9S3_9PROT|nr:flagellar biosynthetic protein FliO [Arboricoccus pini]SNB68904.1 flagellar protein FliO/FliZ [Arboricoccus pini]